MTWLISHILSHKTKQSFSDLRFEFLAETRLKMLFSAWPRVWFILAILSYCFISTLNGVCYEICLIICSGTCHVLFSETCLIIYPETCIIIRSETFSFVVGTLFSHIYRFLDMSHHLYWYFFILCSDPGLIYNNKGCLIIMYDVFLMDMSHEAKLL